MLFFRLASAPLHSRIRLAAWLLLSLLTTMRGHAQDLVELTHRLDPQDSVPVRVLPESAQAPTLPPAALANLEKYWRELINDYQLPGAAIGVVQTDGLVYELTLGQRNVRENQAIDADTLFNLGEATLAFTTLLAATADRPENPVLDRKASTISPLFRMTDPRAQSQCRIRDLLAMSAGLPPYTDEIFDAQWAQPEDVFALLGQAPVMSQPGQRYRHSQTSAAVGGYLIAMAIGNQRRGLYSNYMDVAQEQLLQPLGMSRATFSQRAAKEDGNLAVGHKPAEFGFDPIFVDGTERNPLAPLLGLKLSLNDATRWLQAELSMGLAPDGTRIAQAVSVRERWQPAAVQNSHHRGMGWTRRYHAETEIIQVVGEYEDQSAAIAIYPAYRTGIIVFTNAGGPDANRLLQAVTLGLAEVLKESRQQSPSPSVASESLSQ